ncbi:camphor resistance protein CrcB [Humidesulfovibrio mexicanus]|uniref:Fluoride-specific ion channel FluC n=1 Tax=Humidesulfovibrio mexicanus TaxID=147047 RepID=A0A238XQ49_9BACT|nr:CrcB family protein [Humidesulfovibrio mexicanus]SNR60708.1 camphor resistance protein CrcB [Humidesulfovibrio mexicanus]
MQKHLVLGLAGAAGTLARFWLGGVVQRLAGEAFPLGNFVVNVSGCLFFGFVYAIVESRSGLPGELRLYALTGFMGAYTTFSTYMFESVALMQHGQWLSAGINLAGQTALGVACMVAGLALGRFF